LPQIKLQRQQFHQQLPQLKHQRQQLQHLQQQQLHLKQELLQILHSFLTTGIQAHHHIQFLHCMLQVP
jgi:hypothetical protein